MLTLLLGFYAGGTVVSLRTNLSMGLPGGLATLTAAAWPVIALLETVEDVGRYRRTSRPDLPEGLTGRAPHRDIKTREAVR